jgi:hypothetical protein
MTDAESETIKIRVKAPPPIDQAEHHAAMYALGLFQPLGMATPSDIQPTLGLLSYRSDPARFPWMWWTHNPVEQEPNHGLSSKSGAAAAQFPDNDN